MFGGYAVVGARRRRSVIDPELVKDPLNVLSDSSETNAQDFGNLLVALAVGDPAQDLVFPQGKFSVPTGRSCRPFVDQLQEKAHLARRVRVLFRDEEPRALALCHQQSTGAISAITR